MSTTKAEDRAFVRLHVASLELQGKEIRADEIATRLDIDKDSVLSVCREMFDAHVIETYSDLVLTRWKYSKGKPSNFYDEELDSP